MRENVARFLESLRAQQALYAEMLAKVESQAQMGEDPEALLASLAEQRILKIEIETIQREANAQKKSIDADPLPMEGVEKALIQQEVASVQALLQKLIQAQGAGMEKWQAEKDAVVLRIRQLAQGRRALDAYGARRGARQTRQATEAEGAP